MRSKRILSLVLAFVMVLGTFGTVFAVEPTAEQVAAKFLKEVEVLKGDDEGDLNLDLKLERRDVIILLSRLMDEEEVAEVFPVSEESPTWEDARTDAYYTPFFAWAEVNKYFAGKTVKELAPRDAMTAQDYAVVLLRALGYEADGQDAWKTALEDVKALGILADLTVENATELTRGQAVVMTYNALDVLVKDSTKTLAEILGFVMPVPAALEVVSVSATNLKEIEVEFNQKVDEASATKLDNYSVGLGFEFAELLEDGMTVKLVLKNDNTIMVSQKTYELKTNNVENEAKTLKIAETKTKFVAIDVTVPTIKEVKALGTKAIQVVFSEPVQQSPANSTISYKIDGKVISGSVKYEYPSTVIITTNVTVGEHTLSVTGVKDFQGYAVQQPEVAFTVVEDKTAPEIVSIKSVDLNKVIVEFNEPVKTVANGYHGSKANLAQKPISISSEKVTLVFTNRMGLGNTTIYLDGVEDYSGNKADRNMVITPELDTTRPEVSEVKITDNQKFAITFNKGIDTVKSANLVIKNAEGKVPAGYGLNNKGNPVVLISHTQNDKVATFELTKALPKGTYTLEVTGVQDNTTIKNTMLPYVYNFEVGDTTKPTIVKAWYEENNFENNVDAPGNKRDGYIFVQYSEDMAIDGKGNVLDVVKYNYSDNVNVNVYSPMPSGTVVDLVNGDTVRLSLPRALNLNAGGIRVTLVSDLQENFIADLVGTKNIQSTIGTIGLDKAVATAKDTVKAIFNGKLANVDSNDFTVAGNNVSLDSYTYNANGQTVAIFKLAAGDEVTANVYNVLFKVVGTSSQDLFGAKVVLNQAKQVEDEIAPTVEEIKINGKVIRVTFDEEIEVNSNFKSVVTVKVNGTAQVVSAIAKDDKTLVVTLDAWKSTPVNSDMVEVSVLVANETVEAITDGSNAVEAFTEFVQYGVAIIVQ